MDRPFYLPTSGGPLAAIATLPDNGILTGPAVILLPGDLVARTRVLLLRDIAREFAAIGQPVLRFDYPGAGLSPVPEVVTKERGAEIAAEAARWWLEKTGTEELVLGGTCMGGQLALMAAAQLSACRNVVAVGCPIKVRTTSRSRLRTTLGALDVFKARERGSRSAHWYPEVTRSLATIKENVGVRFVYGELDDFLADFREWAPTEPELSKRVDLAVLPGLHLRGVAGLENYDPVMGEMLAHLRGLTPVPHGD